jgi:WD40 repeat protein
VCIVCGFARRPTNTLSSASTGTAECTCETYAPAIGCARRSKVFIASYRNNRVHIVFIGLFLRSCISVVGDRLAIVNESSDIEVRLVHTGQVVHTISTGDVCSVTGTVCITPVPGHSELIVTSHLNGDVHLWDIEKGELMNMNPWMNGRRARAPNCATYEACG